VRNAELTWLKVTDIDRQRMVIHIQGGKGRKDRDVIISPILLDELRGAFVAVNIGFSVADRYTPPPANMSEVAWPALNRLSCAASLGLLVRPPPRCLPDCGLRAGTGLSGRVGRVS